MIFKKLEIRSFCCEQLRVATQNNKDDFLFLEFGVYKGKSINFFAKECPDLHFIGFDSFRGLNDDWYGTACPRGTFDLDGIAPKCRKNVELKIGDISETLPKFMEEAKGRKILFIHIDTDTYSAASAILSNTKNHLAKSAIILFDELHCYPGWREGEYRALKEHLPRESYEFIAFSQNRAAIRILRPDLVIGC